jgi:hypothetical protein
MIRAQGAAQKMALRGSMLEALLLLQRQTKQLAIGDEQVATLAVAATVLAQELLALCEQQRSCPGTYWRAAGANNMVEPHAVTSPRLWGQGYVGPVRESGESTALCNNCGSAHGRDRRKKQRKIK